jgi:hypothetical protein
VIRGGWETLLSVENLRDLVGTGISVIREVRDFDGMPVVVRVSVDQKGLRVACWGVRGGRVDEENAKRWERQFREAVLALPEKAK